MEARLTEIEPGEVLRYLGLRGTADEALSGQIARCTEKLREASSPRVLWRLFERAPDGIFIGTGFRPEGKAVARHLEGCGAVILMAATLGSGVERLLRRAQAADMAEALVLDACGSAAVENVCDNLCALLAERFSPCSLTSRFSPGYGDFPLKQQRELFAVLDVTRRLGVTLSEGGVMLPQKSVTALIGVSEDERAARKEGCDTCPMGGSCAYRKDGERCGKA